MRSVEDVHKALTDANEIFRYMSKEEIVFSDKNAKDKMLIILAERINVLIWVLNKYQK